MERSSTDELVLVYPASRAQSSMFFLEELAAGAPTYHVPTCYEVLGDLDESALRTAAQGLVDRHEALRTRFALQDGALVQLIASAEPVSWSITEAENKAWSEADTKQWIRDQSHRGFDLENGPLFRVAILRRSATQRVLVLAMHHIAVDGWSLRVLLQELSRGYELATAGKPDDQPRPEFQYADYSSWQDEWLESSEARRQKEYWEAQLAGDLPVVNHPAARRRPSSLDPSSSGVYRFSLPNDDLDRFAALCTRTGATLFTGLLGTFDVLLSRYTELEDIIVGVPVANRYHEEFETTVGLFVNTSVIRADLSSDPSFVEFLSALQETTLDAQDNQDIPFEWLVNHKKPRQDTGNAPIFQVMFTMHHGRDQAWTLPGVDVTELSPELISAKFDLLFDAVQTDDGVECIIDYRSDLLTLETITLFAEHFCTLLGSISSEPDAPVSKLRMLTDAEQEQWLPVPVQAVETGITIHERFAEWAIRTPDAIALCHGDEQVNYAELDRRANRVAHFLQDLGVGPNVMVGISMNRSFDLVVGVLGIMKAGGCYVPLDPAYPQERLRFMVEDSGIGLLLVNDPAARQWQSFPGLVIDLACDDIASCSASAPTSTVSPDDLAYVIFTSGSTGRPKGVLIPHRNISRLFSSTQHWFDFGPDDVWTLFHSYAFDFSVWELWGALAHGGRLIVVDYETSRTPSAFYRLVVDERVTVLNQTPSAFAQFSGAEATSQTGFGDIALRYVIFGGEALEPSSLADWFHRHGDQTPQMVNMYGITETTVHVTYRPITVGDLSTERGSVIGVAIPDLHLYVLNRLGQPVPTGGTGELHIGGAGLALGYLNRPDLTAERFIKNPFSAADDRLYRSGDLVTILPSGELEYRGRVDSQVKLRGFRIELGEIEAVLNEHPAVSGALVSLRHDPEGHPYLSAHVTSTGTQQAVDDDLLRHVSRHLPDYMVPGIVTVLDDFPLTANGKVDWAALPDPRAQATVPKRTYAPPRTEVERALAAIWSVTLGHPQVGIDDSYVSLGGDSIRSIQLIAGAREAGLNFSLTDLMACQTIRRVAEMTTYAPGQVTTGRPIQRFALIPDGDRKHLPDDLEDAYPMTRLQVGMVFHSDLSTSGAGQYHNAWHYRLKSQFSEEAWRTAVGALCERHEVLRTSFDLDRYSEPMQLVYNRVDQPLTFEDLRRTAEQEREHAVTARVRFEASTPFGWERPPFIRFHVQRLGEDTIELHIAEHHAILDGWSERSLFVELLARYRQALALDEAPPTARLSYRFRDFVALERAAVQDEDSIAFWSEAMAGYSFTPFRREGQMEEPTSQRHMAFSLEPVPQKVTHALTRMVTEMEVPLRTLLLAAHLRVMSVVTGAADIVSGAVYNGRGETRDADKCLGLFLNTLPVRLQMDGGTWRELIWQTARQDQAIQLHRRFPMSEISRSTGQRILFDTYFNFTHFHVEESLADQADIHVLDADGSGATNFRFGASFSVRSSDGELMLGMRYDANDRDDEQVTVLRGRYEAALSHMVTGPDARYETTSLLSANEQAAVTDWSAGSTTRDAGAITLTGLVDAAARQHQDKVALVDTAIRLTYRQLADQSNRLARVLRRHGVTPNRLVAVCLEESPTLIVVVLAVLKAGGAYVPLDPDQPPPRLATVLNDAAPALLLTESKHASRLTGYQGERLLLDDLSDMLAVEIGVPLDEVSGSNDLAYVIYTSGSTGKPKGVAVQHREIGTYLSGVRHRLGVESGGMYALSQSMAFDFSMTMLYLSLTSGGTLHLLPRHLTGDELAAAVRDARIDYLKITPSHLQVLAATTDVARLLPRRALILGGEASSHDWTTHLAALGRCAVFNHYGPTEATVGLTVHQVTSDGPGSRWTPIGRPLPGARAYVLDCHLQPTPPGVVGELYLGGDRLARGYLHRAGLTAERFVADPFGPPGARAYRSGDLARWLPDGSLEFLGRQDHQVKIRGHRVELGEIEAALRELPGVAQAVVVPCPPEQPLQILAYVELTPGPGSVASSEFRAELLKSLPEHMVPYRFIPLDRLPLQSHGKVDRKALPDPDAHDPGAVGSGEPPATPTEQAVADVWAEHLPVQHVYATDDFFALGGDSLLATTIVARLRRVFPERAARVRVRDLFSHRSVRALASLLDEQAPANGPTPAAPTPIMERQGLGQHDVTMPSVRQQGMWILNQQGQTSAYNVPIALWLEGPLDREALRRAVADVATRHGPLRTIIELRDGLLQQRVLDPADGLIPLPLVPVTEDEVPATLARLIDQPFDLAEEPPFRSYLLDVDEDRHLLLLVIHHIATDGGSRRPLLRDLGMAYSSRSEDREPDWQPLPLQYSDYAWWQREHLGDPAAPGSEAARQVDYWKAALKNLPVDAIVPPDRPRTAIPTHRGLTRQVVCSAEVHAGLQDLARNAGTTMFTVVHAATAALLTSMGAGADVPIGVPVDGRPSEPTQDLVGLFVNTVVLRTSPTGTSTFRELLHCTREVVNAAWSNQDVPFDWVVEAVNPQRSANRNPLFQVLMTVQDAAPDAEQLAGLTTRLESLEASAAKFDMSFGYTRHRDIDGSLAELAITVGGNADLYESATIRTVAERTAALLAAVAMRPDVALAALQLRGGAAWSDRPLESQTHLHPAAAAATSRARAGVPLHDELCRLMAEVLKVPEVGIDDDFFALGGHSLLAILFLDRVRGLTDVDDPRKRLNIRDLYRFPTVAGLAERLSAHEGSDPLASVIRMRMGEGSAEPLLCLPSITGLAWAWSGILPHVDPRHPVLGLQSPHLLAPQATPATFEELVDEHVARILDLDLKGALHLVGWSFGGVLAHAVGARLQAQGRRVGILALLDARPLTAQHARSADTRWLLGVLLGDRANGLIEPDSDKDLVDLVRGNDPVLGSLSVDQVSAVVATTRANREKFLRYRVHDRFEGDMIFFNALRTRRSTGQATWGPHVQGEIREQNVDCGHMEMTRPEPLAQIGQLLDRHLRSWPKP